MYIINGKYKKRKLFFTKNKKLIRPTQNVVKEIIFNILEQNKALENLIFLDCFAGVGQIGCEALSRGVKLTYFIDNSIIAKKYIEKNIKKLNISNCNYKIVNKNIFHLLNNNALKNLKFDIIFLDPPYKNDPKELIFCLKKIFENNYMKQKGIIVFESYKKNQLVFEKYLNNIKNKYNFIWKQKNYSKTLIIFLFFQ